MPRLPLSNTNPDASTTAATESTDATDATESTDTTDATDATDVIGATDAVEVTAIASRIRFDLTTVRLFIATAELGGITHAAHSLFLVPAAASRRIRELEAQLGLPLFDRLPHGMALTDAGRAMLAHARSVLHAVDRMQDDAAAFLHGNRGVVRIAACTSAVMQFLPSQIAACHIAHPGIRIDLQELNSQGVIQAIKRGVVDVGIYEASFGSLTLPTTVFREDRLVAVVRSGSPLANRDEVGIAELLNFDIIGLTEGSSISVTLGKLAAERHRSLSMRIRVGSFDSMIAMVAAGIGVGVMPEGIATTLAKAPALVQVAIVEPWAHRRFLMCRQSDTDLSGAAQTIFDFLGA